MRLLFTALACFISVSVFGQELSPEIGDYYGGGIVFWINPEEPGQGLVCDLYDIFLIDENTGAVTSYFPFGCYGTDVEGANGLLFGDGFQNTSDISNGCPEDNIAAKLCSESTNGGFSDWFLPSVDELYELNISFQEVYDALYNNSGHVLSGNDHWTSSEHDEYEAHIFNFQAGPQLPGGGWVGAHGYHPKSSPHVVRAIRYFDFNPYGDTSNGEDYCGEGTTWDEITSTCISSSINQTDLIYDGNGDGCVDVNDMLNLLLEYGSCE